MISSKSKKKKLSAALALTCSLFATSAIAGTETILYNFNNTSTTNGYYPKGTLTRDGHGNLFGATVSGGTHGEGTVFRLSPSGPIWAETDLYNFQGGIDGNTPLSGVFEDAQGNLWGTTEYGGAAGGGIFYEVIPGLRWTEAGVYNFAGGVTGSNPINIGGLIQDSNGNFYGTTSSGGLYGQGLVFEMTITGSGLNTIATETVLYNFDNTYGHVDGSGPVGGVIMDAAGNLYGTTSGGGTNNSGIVFKLTKQEDGNYVESLLHLFTGWPSDGSSPQASLVMDSLGNLYGTTNGGGPAAGTVFELTPLSNGQWGERIIFNFSGSYGANPLSNLIIDTHHNLYGTTTGGGDGFGTVFELSLSGPLGYKETVLYSFNGPGDGNYPVGGVVFDQNGNLYGTNWYGAPKGGGTVFKITP